MGLWESFINLLLSIFARSSQTVVYPPEAHFFQNVDVYLNWNPKDLNDRKVQDIAYVLKTMNRLLYRACDGQIRIAKFRIYSERSIPKPEAPGAIHFIPETDPQFSDGTAAFASDYGSPNKPKSIYGSYEIMYRHEPVDSLNHYAYTMLMEFSHAYFGMADEYATRTADGKIRVGGSKCPNNMRVACPLEHNNGNLPKRSKPDMDKFCGPPDWGDYAHFEGEPKNLQEQERGMSCYKWLQKVMQDDLGKQIVIPTKPLPRIDDVRFQPIFEYVL